MICFVLSTFISLTPILPTFECIAMVALNADFQIQMYTIDPEIFANHFHRIKYLQSLLHDVSL